MKNMFVSVTQRQNLSHAFTRAHLKPSSHFIQIPDTRIKRELPGNKTKRRTGNEAAKENRTDFAKVSAIWD